VVNKTTKRAREDILDGGNNEFPVVDKRVHCHEHRDIYFLQAPGAALWWSRVARFDAQTGASEGYDFGPGYYLNEPSFAADASRPVNLAARDEGRFSRPPPASVRLRCSAPMRCPMGR
jgi:carotenoid cleavage dioxygenase-like enzyme